VLVGVTRLEGDFLTGPKFKPSTFGGKQTHRVGRKEMPLQRGGKGGRADIIRVSSTGGDDQNEIHTHFIDFALRLGVGKGRGVSWEII